MYVVSGSRQRTIMLMDEDRRLGMSPNITHGDLAPDRMSSTKLKRVSVWRGWGGGDSRTLQVRNNSTQSDFFSFRAQLSTVCKQRLHKQVVE